MGNSGDLEMLNWLETSISSIVLHCIACLWKSSEHHTDVRWPHPNQVFVDRKLVIKRYSKTLNSAHRVPRALKGAYKLNLPSKALQVPIFASRSLQVLTNWIPYKVLIWLKSKSLGVMSGHSSDWVDSCKNEWQKKRFSFGTFSDSASRPCNALPADFQGTDFPSSLLVFCRHLHSLPSAELLALTDNPPSLPPPDFLFISFFFCI